MAEDFGEAEYLLSIHHNLSLLKCESRTNPKHFWLYKKDKTKRLANGSQSTYFICSNCSKLGDKKARMTVKDDRLMTDPEAGHHPLCAPMDYVYIETLRLKRDMIHIAENGQEPLVAYCAGLALIEHRFPDPAVRDKVESIVPAFTSVRSSLYRSKAKRNQASLPSSSTTATQGDFGEAEYFLSGQYNLSLLKCESRSNPEHFWLYKKDKTKRLTDGTESTYFICSNCNKFGNKSARMTVKHNRLVKDPEIGHNALCSPMDHAALETIRLKRDVKGLPEKGYKPLVAFRSGLDLIEHRFPSPFQENPLDSTELKCSSSYSSDCKG